MRTGEARAFQHDAEVPRLAINLNIKVLLNSFKYQFFRLEWPCSDSSLYSLLSSYTSGEFVLEPRSHLVPRDKIGLGIQRSLNHWPASTKISLFYRPQLPRIYETHLKNQ